LAAARGANGDLVRGTGFIAADATFRAVLASLLGIHIQTAVNWASHTRRDWTTYLAERVSTSHQGT
jgi:hypothetical protein